MQKLHRKYLNEQDHSQMSNLGSKVGNLFGSFSDELGNITLREEILAGRNFGGFGGFVKNPPNSAKLTSRQN